MDRMLYELKLVLKSQNYAILFNEKAYEANINAQNTYKMQASKPSLQKQTVWVLQFSIQ